MVMMAGHPRGHAGGIIFPGKAIPTVYRGIIFRSRLEADTAYLLTNLGIDWEYEKHSFLLEDGLHFALDFLAPEIRLFIEDRGYENEKGNRQIAQFAAKIHEGFPCPGDPKGGRGRRSESSGGDGPGSSARVMDFLVIGPDEVLFHEHRGRFGVEASPAVLARCLVCRGFFFLGESGCYQCRRCGEWRGDHHLASGLWGLALEGGTIQIDGAALPDWIAAMRMRGSIP